MPTPRPAAPLASDIQFPAARGYTSGMTVTRTSLLRRLRDPADERAWIEFNVVYKPMLRNYVGKYNQKSHLNLRDDDVDDVVQDVFIKLFRTLPTFELDKQLGRFRTWLWRVTINATLDWAARHKRHKPINEADPPVAKDERPDEDWDRTYYAAIMKAVLERVRREVEAENPKKWASFVEHKLKGRPAAEVAAELGINANLVYQNALRVYRRIEEHCRLEYGEELEND